MCVADNACPGQEVLGNRGSQNIWQKIRAYHKFTACISGYLLPGTSGWAVCTAVALTDKSEFFLCSLSFYFGLWGDVLVMHNHSPLFPRT